MLSSSIATTGRLSSTYTNANTYMYECLDSKNCYRSTVESAEPGLVELQGLNKHSVEAPELEEVCMNVDWSMSAMASFKVWKIPSCLGESLCLGVQQTTQENYSISFAVVSRHFGLMVKLLQIEPDLAGFIIELQTHLSLCGAQGDS
ncbi:hypothetical protein M758_9G099100 [Ceratodon purpureus]|nr:hypothetical protein M758_9G099100 [Ceratodon purpureus]